MANKEKDKKDDLYIKNKHVFHDYIINNSNIYEAGMVLEGYEIKSIIAGHISLLGAYCKVTKDDEIFVVDMFIKRYENGMCVDTLDEYRDRKLLLKKQEIKAIAKKVREKGFTIVPVNIHLSKGGTAVNNRGDVVSKKKNIIKMDIAVAQGAKNYDKREAIKKKDLERDMARSK